MEQNFYGKVRQISQDIPTAYRKEQFEKIETALRNLISVAEDADQKHYALGMLADHYHFTKNQSCAEETIKECVTLLPENADGWLRLTEHFHYHDEDISLAAEHVEVALQKALVAKQMVRQVLGVRIRIALAQKNYGLVNDSLEKLVIYKPAKGGFDVAFESDFVEQIPVHLVDENILNQYKALAKL